jgi:hypothetical protein
MRRTSPTTTDGVPAHHFELGDVPGTLRTPDSPPRPRPLGAA